jgi:hypothetical protein
MKKIHYLLALVALAFTACQKQPYIAPTTPLTKTGAVSFTLQSSDYQLLPGSVYASKTFSFYSTADAYNYIPAILTAKESADLNNGSTAAITYTLAPQVPQVKVADSLYSDIAYTVTAADYTAVTGNNYGDFEASDVAKFLAYKYPAPVANQLAVITYELYTGVDVKTTSSFLYLNNNWVPAYTVTPAEYTEVGEGKYDELTSSDVSKLPGYFNFFLKNDITIADTAKAGDIEYVSYNFYGTDKKDYQKVMALAFDGTNWNTRIASSLVTANFKLTNKVWTPVLPVPTFYHTLTPADITLIANSNFSTAALRSNLGKYGDFESGWSTTDLDGAFELVLTTDYPNPQTGANYIVTYLAYNGGDTATNITFTYSGTAFVPAQ